VMLGNGPGPEESGLTVVMYLYDRGFVSGDLGYASAVGWTLVTIVLMISLFQMRLSGTWRKEDA
jgi:ABC-type sugar transport system permease subunit